MPEVYLASSALAAEGFDGHKTIEAAADFDGVQLFLDGRYHDRGYLEEAISKLKESGLGLVLHLPNSVTEADIDAAERIVQEFPEVKVLIHYLPTIELPVVAGTRVGWENSLVGPLNEGQRQHIEMVKEMVETDETFYVFDMGRLLAANDDTDRAEVIEYLKTELIELDPTRDIIHLIDQTSWILKFRDCMCVLGVGIMGEVLDDIRAFEGVIVLEHEDLQMALKSLAVLRNKEF